MKSKKHRHETSSEESDESQQTESTSESESEDSSESERRQRKRRKHGASSDSEQSESESEQRAKRRKHKKKKKKHGKKKRREESDDESDSVDSSVSEGQVSPSPKKKKKHKHKRKHSKRSRADSVSVKSGKKHSDEGELSADQIQQISSDDENPQPSKTYYQKEYRPTNGAPYDREREVQRFYRGSSKERRWAQAQQDQNNYDREHASRPDKYDRNKERYGNNSHHSNGAGNDYRQREYEDYRRHPKYEGRPNEQHRRPVPDQRHNQREFHGHGDGYGRGNEYDQRGPPRKHEYDREYQERRGGPPEPDRFHGAPDRRYRDGPPPSDRGREFRRPPPQHAPRDHSAEPDTRRRDDRPAPVDRERGPRPDDRRNRDRDPRDKSDRERSDVRERNDVRERSDVRERTDFKERGDVRERADVRERSDVREKSDIRERSDVRDRSDRERGDVRDRGEVRERADVRERGEVRERADVRDRGDAKERSDARERGDVKERSNVRERGDDRRADRRDKPEPRSPKRERKSRFANAEEGAEYAWGGVKSEPGEKGSAGDKEKPNFGLSGKLAADANTVNGVVLKYAEPEDARQPKRRWRFYPFKGDKALPILYIHRQSAFIMGRDKKAVDIHLEHPSVSKQHAALQYRATPFTRPDGSQGRRVRPYIIDLDSANGTFVNNKKIEARRFVELLERDVVKFGFSQREYVLLHENSRGDAMDDDHHDVPDATDGPNVSDAPAVTTTERIKQEKRAMKEAVEDGE